MRRALLAVCLTACAHIPSDARPMEPAEERAVRILREMYDQHPETPPRRERCMERELRLVVRPIEELERQCVLSIQYGRFQNLACLGQRGNRAREVVYVSEGHEAHLAVLIHEAAHDALRCAQVGSDPYHTRREVWGKGGVVRRAEERL